MDPIENKQENSKYNYLSLMAMLLLLTAVIPDIIEYKLIAFGPLNVSASALIFPMNLLFQGIVAEVYGYKIVRQLLWYMLACDILFSLLITLIVHLPASPAWHNQAGFEATLGSALRVSVIGDLVGQVCAFLNVYLLVKGKILFKGRFFWLRSLMANSIAEIFVVSSVIFFVFYGVQPLEQMINIMISVYLFKLFFAIIYTIPGNLITNFLKRKENLDVDDSKTKFSPFILLSE